MRSARRTITTARFATVLGLLACVGPRAIDMNLPALPTVAAELDAPIAAVQGTLIDYFIGLGVSQLAWGPISDQVGRKAPVVCSTFSDRGGDTLCPVLPPR